MFCGSIQNMSIAYWRHKTCAVNIINHDTTKSFVVRGWGRELCHCDRTNYSERAASWRTNFGFKINLWRIGRRIWIAKGVMTHRCIMTACQISVLTCERAPKSQNNFFAIFKCWWSNLWPLWYFYLYFSTFYWHFEHSKSFYDIFDAHKVLLSFYVFHRHLKFNNFRTISKKLW